MGPHEAPTFSVSNLDSPEDRAVGQGKVLPCSTQKKWRSGQKVCS